jgi:hypothetical protein
MSIEPTKNITVDHTKPLTVSVIVHSIHVVEYRLWTRPDAATAWTLTGKGTTEDTIVDSHDLAAVPAGSSLFYWLGVGGPSSSTYKVQLLFLQDGKILHGGMILDEKDADANGAGVTQRKVVFP